MSERNAERHLAPRERHNAGQAEKRALAQQLRQLAAKLEAPRGIRVSECTPGRISGGFAHVLDQSKWVSCGRAVDPIRRLSSLFVILAIMSVPVGVIDLFMRHSFIRGLTAESRMGEGDT